MKVNPLAAARGKQPKTKDLRNITTLLTRQDEAPPLAVLMVQSTAKSIGEEVVESTVKGGSVTVGANDRNDRITVSSNVAGEGGSEGVELV